jgi:hypothetical protein
MERDAERAAHQRELSECQRALAEQKTHTQCLQTTVDQQLATIARLETTINAPTTKEKISMQYTQLKHKLDALQHQLAATQQNAQKTADYPQLRARVQDLEFKLGQSEHERSILKSSYFARHNPTSLTNSQSSTASTNTRAVAKPKVKSRNDAKSTGTMSPPPPICTTLAPACKTEGGVKNCVAVWPDGAFPAPTDYAMPDMLESMRTRLRALETQNQELQAHVTYLRRRLLDEAEKSVAVKQPTTATPTPTESASEKSPQTETSTPAPAPAPAGLCVSTPAAPASPVTLVHHPSISLMSPSAIVSHPSLKKATFSCYSTNAYNPMKFV